jgi:hypothetical protein
MAIGFWKRMVKWSSAAGIERKVSLNENDFADIQVER